MLETKSIIDYLNQAKKWGIVPNFWLTEEYLTAPPSSELQTRTDGKRIWIEEEELLIFPPLPISEQDVKMTGFPPKKIWSDFENYSVGEVEEFLDWEYQYDSDEFSSMKGGKWESFRKNSRKWPFKSRDRGWEYTRKAPSKKEITRLLITWLDSRPAEETIQDDDSMLWFLFHGKNRGFLYSKNELIGINVWDSNEPYLMYRYCMTKPEEPFLNEFMRVLFYRYHPGVIVIDGGCLDNPGLERFKDKLNPIKKRAVYSRFTN